MTYSLRDRIDLACDMGIITFATDLEPYVDPDTAEILDHDSCHDYLTEMGVPYGPDQ